VGNKADVSGNDLLAYWAEDENTDAILLYLESVGNPRRFARLTRQIGKKKPIVVVKSGRSKAGKRAAASHTGSVATSEVTVDALFSQSGVIRTDTLEEMFDVATLLANQPAPAGDRVAIITNAGGLGIMCADACEANGLQVLPLDPATVEELESFLPTEASAANPVDMIASAAPKDYARTIEVVAADPSVDALIIIYIPPDPSRASEIASCIKEGIQEVGGRIPILTAFMSARGLPPELQGHDVKVPSYRFPEQAAIALAHAARYGRWRAREEGDVPEFADLRSDEATSVIAEALKSGGGWLEPEQVERLFSCYGLPVAHIRVARTPEEAGAIADEIHHPVALKAVGTSIVHKTELGGVRLGLHGALEVSEAARAMQSSIEASGVELEGFAVQPMVGAGVEVLVGVFHDRLFGPVVAVGAGGTAVELVKDVSVRISPLTDLDASEMVRSLATFPLLDGYRGSPPADIAALEDMLLRVSALVENHPEVAEMDCNPVIVLTRDAIIVDARVRVETPPPPRPLSSRLVAV
jgi:acyl-CoA synthetase (NDP forming)